MNEAKEIGVEVHGRAPTPARPVMVYLIAFFFTAAWLLATVSAVYVAFFKIPAEDRSRMLMLPVLLPMGIAEVNGLLTVVAAWLLVALRRAATGLFLASTMIVLALGVLAWPSLLQLYMRSHNPGIERAFLQSGSNLVLHIAATIYAFHLGRRGLLR